MDKNVEEKQAQALEIVKQEKTENNAEVVASHDVSSW